MSTIFDPSSFFTPSAASETRNIPKRTGIIERVHIKDKLAELGFTPGVNLSLGIFDQIGEITAKKTRDPSNDLFHTAGFFFRPNYERGLLIYALVKYFKAESFLEIGFGRGYGSVCALMAMHENNIGKVTTVDPAFDQEHLKRLYSTYPSAWFERLLCIQGTSQDFLKSDDCDQRYDLIFIDGDHRYEAVKEDWALCEGKLGHAIIFDDYHLPGVDENDIEVASVVDHIDGYDKQLVILDRRVFIDDRKLTDDEINYGIAIITKSE